MKGLSAGRYYSNICLVRRVKDVLLQPLKMLDFKEYFRLYFSVVNFDKLYFLLEKDYTTEHFVFLCEGRSLSVCVYKMPQSLGQILCDLLTYRESIFNQMIDSLHLPLLCK